MARLVALEIELFIFSFLDSLLKKLEAIFGVLCWVYHFDVHLVYFPCQICLELFIFRLYSYCPTHRGFWGLNWDVALVLRACSDDWGIENFELAEQAVLISQDGDPGFFPRFRGIYDLQGCMSDRWSTGFVHTLVIKGQEVTTHLRE